VWDERVSGREGAAQVSEFGRLAATYEDCFDDSEA
jgi:hypothetical protein